MEGEVEVIPMSRLVTAALMTGALMPAAAFGGPADPATVGRVRPLQKSAAAVLKNAVHRSPTITAMIDRIEQSDVIVYINVAPYLPREPAQTTMVSATKVCRYLMVTLDARTGMHELVALLGHELQHVIEIVDAPDVRDNLGMRTHFRRIGIDPTAGDRFETEAARQVTVEIRQELRDPKLVGLSARRRALASGF
jgi:hypothetical protein